MASRRSVLIMVAWMVASLTAHAQGRSEAEVEPRKNVNVEEVPEYGGVVVDQTLTGMGRLFHVKFSESWSEREDVSAYVLSIRERPSPRGGTEVIVYSSDQIVYRAGLPRTYPSVVAMSEAAAERVHDTLVQMNLQSTLFNDPDLAKSAY